MEEDNIALDEEEEIDHEGDIDVNEFDNEQEAGLEDYGLEEVLDVGSSEDPGEQEDEQKLSLEEMSEEEEEEITDGEEAPDTCRTSGHEFDDYNLPDDPEKANVKLQAILMEELKKRSRYARKIDNYFATKEPGDFTASFATEQKDLTDVYQKELKNLKKILDAFSDSYDDFNFKLKKVMKRCDENETLRKFFMESSRKIIYDAQKKVDKKELDRITKKQGLEKFIDGIFLREERIGELLVEKALIALEIEQAKYLVYGEGEDADIDLLQLFELQKQVCISAQRKIMQEQHIKKMQTVVSTAVNKIPCRVHQMRYNHELKDKVINDIRNKINKQQEERTAILMEMRNTSVVRSKNSAQFTKKKLKELKKYLKIYD